MNLYITADLVGAESGGGIVTRKEFESLNSLEHTRLHARNTFPDFPSEPFEQDRFFLKLIQDRALPDNYYGELKLAHGYAGCLSETMEELFCMGVKTTYTAAAHDVEESRKEHELLGMPYNYPHLTNPELWSKYLAGYLLANTLICPSTHSANIMRKYGRVGKIEVIPHGVTLPMGITPPPKEFRVGYLGAIGPDKGIIYLLKAWSEINYKDATLVFAGSQSQSSFMQNMINVFCVNNPETVKCIGWVDNVAGFYGCISCYVQASVSEGYAIEVNEAYAHGRPVLCSTGAGASDIVPEVCKFQPRDYKELAHKISLMRKTINQADQSWFKGWQQQVKDITWEKVQDRYIKVWRKLLNNGN